MPLPLTISCCSKSRLVLPLWCRLTRVVPDKIQEGRKTVCVCVCVCFTDMQFSYWHPQVCWQKSMAKKGSTEKKLKKLTNCSSMPNHLQRYSQNRKTNICSRWRSFPVVPMYFYCMTWDAWCLFHLLNILISQSRMKSIVSFTTSQVNCWLKTCTINWSYFNFAFVYQPPNSLQIYNKANYQSSIISTL